MDGDIGELLESVLRDPEQMNRIAAAAQSLMNADAAVSAPMAAGAPAPVPAPSQESKLLASISGLLGQKSEQSRSAALLNAMRPYMRPEKQEKLDRAMQITRMVRIAGTVMREWGGDRHGV